METFTRFLYDFLGQFFSGVGTMFSGIGQGFKRIFDFSSYTNILNNYKTDLSIPEWILVAIAIGLLLLLLGLIIFLIVLIIKKYIKIRKKAIDQESLLQEVGSLNGQVAKLMKEKEEILAMKVSQLGLKPDESPYEQEDSSEEVNTSDTRFEKLITIDKMFENYKIKNYNNSFTLPELCNNFRNFAASRLHLYYTKDMMRLFVSALASTKLVILQGISGTGKTSLA